MLRCLAAAGCLIVASSLGCTHVQLTRNTALTATTVTTIQYQMVLNNLAAISCEPGMMPAHVRLADGTVQISNQLGFGESGGFTAFSGGDFGIERYGPFGSSRVSEQWGTDAVEDPLQLWELQTIYRKAFGMPELPKPNYIAEGLIARNKPKNEPKSKESSGESQSKSGSSSNASGSDQDRPELDAAYHGDGEELAQHETDGDSPPPIWLLDHAQESEPSSGRSEELPAPDSVARTQSDLVPGNLAADAFDIPTGWFSVGCKKDVPPNACYVGRYKDRYAWVTPEGVQPLSEFTLAVLAIIKLDASNSGSSGLMFTP